MRRIGGDDGRYNMQIVEGEPVIRESVQRLKK